MLKHIVVAIALAVLSALGMTPSWAQTGPVKEIPVETLFKKSQYRGLQFSPNQKLVAVLAPINGRTNLVVIDVEKKKANALTGFTSADVTSSFWATNERLIFTTGDQQGFELRGDGGLFAIDADGGHARTLVEPVSPGSGKFVLRLTSVVGRIKGNQNEIIVSANDRNAKSQDLYRMNIQNGRKTLLSFVTPGQVIDWTLDKNDVPRAAFSNDPDKVRWWFSYRSSEDAPWKTVAEWDASLKNVIIPYSFDPADNSKMYVLSNIGRDTLAFFKFDPETGKLGDLVYGDDRYDMGSFHMFGEGLGEGGRLIFDGNDEDPGKLIGVTYQADKPRTIWFDDASRKAQAQIDAALPKAINSFNPSRRRALVRSYSDVDPGHYYIFDQDKKTLEDTAITPAPWIDPKVMAPMEPVSWTARDGMRIDGYLTLPLNYKVGSPVPLILHPHGGPWAKDNWRYDPEVQFMANRGYAVLQPNFRGSTGYGTKHLVSSYKHWGDTMINDMIDGVEWAIKEGYADKNRIGVYGASYGGYATLMSMVTRPDLFKWGVNYVGVSDMFVHQSTQPAQKLGDFGPLAKITNGDSSADREMFERTSPTKQVNRIAAPIFNAYGGEDRNVDPANGDAIKSALAGANKPYEWMFVPIEGHGYRADENVFAFYNRFDAFIKKYTPPAP